MGVVVLTAAGCQQPSSSVPPATTEVDHAAEARKAFERQDWGTAAPHFRLAIEKSPEAFSLHYGLALSASWLDIRDAARREFQWVGDHAPMRSEEARVAREALDGANRRSVASSRPGADAAAAKDETVG